jgi:hypothetical protein
VANGRPAPTEKYSPRRRRPTPGAQAPEKADFNRRKGLRPTVGLRRPKNTLRVGEGRRPARSASEGRFQSAQRPPANGRLYASNEFDLEGLRPTVGLRRPKNTLRVGEGRRPARSASEGRFQSAQRPPANGRLYASNEFDLEGLRPTVGLRRPKNTLRVGEGRRLARSALEADFNRHESLRPTVGLRRPKNTLRVGEGRRPARKRLRRLISIGAKASGQRSACAPNEFGLQRPSANGRPAPTEKYSPRRRRPTPGAQAPQKADFNRREGLRPAVGLCAE